MVNGKSFLNLGVRFICTQLAPFLYLALFAFSISSTSAKDVDVSIGKVEKRILSVDALISVGNLSLAQQKAQDLLRDYPTYHLVKVLLGDIYSLRAGEARLSQSQPQLKQISEELALRQKAQKQLEKIVHSAPNYVYYINAKEIKFFVVVDVVKSRLYVLKGYVDKNQTSQFTLVASYYATIGKDGFDKFVEGDNKTPLGLYFITGFISPKSLDQNIYGTVGALPISYPNEIDKAQGRTGGGIWLHGTPQNYYTRERLSSRGCVSLADDDLAELMKTISGYTIPIFIGNNLDWLEKKSPIEQEIQKNFDEMQDSLAKNDIQKYIDFYSSLKINKQFTTEDNANLLIQLMTHEKAEATTLLTVQDPHRNFVQQIVKFNTGTAKKIKTYYWQKNKQNEWKIVGLSEEKPANTFISLK